MKKRVVALFLSLLLLFTGYALAESTEPITLRYATCAVGTHTHAPVEEEILDRFNAKFGDTINLEIEELPSPTAYTDKMKILAATNELPDLIDGKNGLLALAIKNGQAIDLVPYLEADPEFAAFLGEDLLDKYRDEEGHIYSLNPGVWIVGYFYNKEMFEDCGITPAKTWEEFDSNCEKLLAKGYAPLGLMTGENCWTTNLLLAAMVGTSGEAGNVFINTVHPETYQTPEFIAALDKMGTYLSKYTTPDALGALYANVANNFCQEQVAMIFNGLWMAPDFADPTKSTEGFNDKVGVAIYPGGGVIVSYSEGFAICSSTKEKQDACWELLKCFCDEAAQVSSLKLESGFPSGNVTITDEIKQADPYLAALLELKNTQSKYDLTTLDTSAYASVVDAFGKYYPDLAYGIITAEEMAAKLDEAAAASK